MVEINVTTKEYLTLKEAADLFEKSVYNISYLVQYRRINKYYKIEEGEILKSTKIKGKNIKKNATPVVSFNELNSYFQKIKEREKEIIEKVPNCNTDLLFFDLSEKERTKHVHRLHPYLGKFIPQLVEYYLNRNFERGDIILDPFMGSGTTLVEANTKNMRSIGIDVSKFNCKIAEAKMKKYDLKLLKKEFTEILEKTTIQSSKKRVNGEIFINGTKVLTNFIDKEFRDFSKKYETENKYINKWFARQTKKEMLIYKSLIPNYTYQNLLTVLLSRAIRSARLTFHFQLTRLKEPIYEPYVCYKHKNKVCVPTQSLLGFLNRYTKDTLRRIKEFSKLRTNQIHEIINDDSRKVDLTEILSSNFKNEKINGIITSPPYVGLINYHKQHSYAYELFGIEQNIEKEIGRKDLGKSQTAMEEYKISIAEVFENIKRFLKENAKVFIVANDKNDLYPEIAELSGYKIIDRDERPVTKKASRERAVYTESIFHFKPI